MEFKFKYNGGAEYILFYLARKQLTILPNQIIRRILFIQPGKWQRKRTKNKKIKFYMREREREREREMKTAIVKATTFLSLEEQLG